MRLPKSLKIRIGLAMMLFFTIFAVIGPWIAPYNPNASSSTTTAVPQPPSAAHWLGTTQVQQDVLSQLLVGGRSTILVSLVAGVVATMLAIVLGVTAGYYGGRLDDVLSMLANIFLVMPALPLLIVIFGFLSNTANPNDLLIGVVISLTGWAFGARVLRAQTLSMRSRDFVDSARLIGERGWRIMMFEILPNLVPIVATSFLFTVIYGVGAYTALSFIGVFNVRTGAGARCSTGRKALRPRSRCTSSGGGSCHQGWPSACSGPRWRCSASASTSSSTHGCARPGSPGAPRQQACHGTCRSA
jgi:peptide/nickel transport system permease protein